MPSFQGGNGAFTPSTSNDNWTLSAGTTGQIGKVVGFNWGGRLTTSTGYRTRWVRPSTAGVGAGTALTLGYSQPNYTTAGLALFSTFATSQPVLPADPGGNLWAQDWNAQGGVGAIVLPLANPWWVINGLLQSELSCRNVAGTDANGSTYGVIWEE